jgi:hypothetical protein
VKKRKISEADKKMSETDSCLDWVKKMPDIGNQYRAKEKVEPVRFELTSGESAKELSTCLVYVLGFRVVFRHKNKAHALPYSLDFGWRSRHSVNLSFGFGYMRHAV